MSDVVVARSELCGQITAMPSKSFTHRILICSAFSDAPVIVKGVACSDDVLATLGCLRALGAEATFIGDDCVINPIYHAKNAVLDCGESGSTLRFMLAVASAVGGEHTFTGKGRLFERPIKGLADALSLSGVNVKVGDTLKISGKLKGGELLVDGSVSSQYISGLLLASPIVGEDVKITVKGGNASRAYIKMTVDVMRAFGIAVEEAENTFFIKGGQSYKSPKEIAVEGDWSNACFFIAGGLLSGRVEIFGLNPNSLQADKNILSAINALGGKARFVGETLVVEKSSLIGGEIEVENMIDAAPVLAVLCLAASGKSVIRGVDRLRYKESDRLSAIVNMVRSAGGRADIKGNALEILGINEPLPCKIDGENDHRIVMAAVMLGGFFGGVRVTDAEAVNKSYPAFFADYRKIGGVFDEL